MNWEAWITEKTLTDSSKVYDVYVSDGNNTVSFSADSAQTAGELRDLLATRVGGLVVQS